MNLCVYGYDDVVDVGVTLLHRNEPRHGTRVTALAEKPFFDPKAPTRRQALGLAGPEDV